MSKKGFRVSLVKGDGCIGFDFEDHHELMAFVRDVFEYVDDPAKCSLVINCVRREVEDNE